MEPVRLTSPEGVEYRDLNGNGQMDPFEDPRRTVDERVEDLLGRMSLQEKAGLMFQTVIEAGTAAIMPYYGMPVSYTHLRAHET